MQWLHVTPSDVHSTTCLNSFWMHVTLLELFTWCYYCSCCSREGKRTTYHVWLITTPSPFHHHNQNSANIVTCRYIDHSMWSARPGGRAVINKTDKQGNTTWNYVCSGSGSAMTTRGEINSSVIEVETVDIDITAMFTLSYSLSHSLFLFPSLSLYLSLSLVLPLPSLIPFSS